MAALVAAALVTAALGPVARPVSAQADVTPTVAGTVFVDTDGDGAFGTGDTGVAGVTVRAFDAEGNAAGTATSMADGSYVLALATAHTGIVRIEFDTPAGYQSTFVSGGSGTSVQFVAPGSTDVDYGLFNPSSACASLLAVCMHQGIVSDRPTEFSIGLVPFSPPTTLQGGRPVATDQTGALITPVAEKGDTGATWGLGWQRSTALVWNSAVIRRHSDLGPEGIGGVYVYDLEGTAVASFDLTDLGLVLHDPQVSFSAAARDIRSATTAVVGETGTSYGTRNNIYESRDIPGFAAVGTAGLGDLDISDDSSKLWVTNLYERKVHRVALGGTAAAPTLGAAQAWSVDDGHTCAGGTGPLRPWGLDPRPDGKIVVAAVCTNESADPLTKPLPGKGIIFELDPAATGSAAWTTLTEVDFSYAHNYDYCDQAPYTCTWKAWTNDWSALETVAKRSGQYWWTQPMIVNIGTLADGSFVLGVNDRMSYQGGNTNYKPLDLSGPGYQTTWTAGDTLLLCRTETGWLQESGGGCAGTTQYTSNRQGEFFQDDYGHPETTIGGLAVAGSQVAVGAMDPADYFLGGIRWVSAVNGNQTNALNLTKKASSINDGFGKASAIGDLEAICDSAPLQIGNRVWYDIDGDGIQDPDEPPVIGVTVRLYDGPTLVGTAVTNDAGEYYFTSTLTEAADGGTTPDEFGGNLEAGVAYTIVMDETHDCDDGGPLEGWSLTVEDATTTSGPADRDDRIDSDATATGTSWCGHGPPTVVVDPLAQGIVDHTFDIGFSVPSVFVGDLVWFDADDDGVLDPAEAGVPGVVLELTDAQGNAVVDVFGVPVGPLTTDEFGRYRFANLPLGTYTVRVTVPDGYELVSGGQQAVASIDFTTLGTGDRLLDFGLRVAGGDPADPQPEGPGGGRLPVTGFGGGPLVGAGLLLAAGGALLLARQRRHAAVG